MREFQEDFRVLRILHFRLGLAVSREAQFSRISDLSLDFIETSDMAAVEFVGLSYLEQVLPVVAVDRAQVTVVQDQLLVLVRLVGESIRDNIT